MYCSQCGAENSDQAIQCVNCGSPLIAAGQPQPDGLAQSQTCGLAIASLVMGILSIFCNFIMAIPAIICGIIALVKINNSRGQLKGNGFAIAGIAVPALVMVLVTPILLAIMIPAFSKAKESAQRVICMANMKGLSTGLTVYMNDYEDECPTPEKWCDLLMQEAGVLPQNFRCPVSPEVDYAYAMNENFQGLNKQVIDFAKVGKMVVIFEADLGKNGVGDREDVILRHTQNGQIGSSIVFADGHIEFVTEDRLDDLVWTFK